MSAARIVSLPVGFLSCLALLPTQFAVCRRDAPILRSQKSRFYSSLQACVQGDGAGGRSPSPNAQTIIVPAANSVPPPLFALDGCALLPGLLLSVEAARALVPVPAVSPLLSRGVVVGLQRGEQQQRGRWCPGGIGGLGARSVWPGCAAAAAARPPRARAVQGAGKQMMPRWGAWGLWEATGPGKKKIAPGILLSV